MDKSANHRAFELVIINDHKLKINFKPTNECISKARRNKKESDRFISDVHLIQANRIRCCNNERHAEIGRYYMCGSFEYCQIVHYPDIVDFGEVLINNKYMRTVHFRNNSNKITCNLFYSKVTAIEVNPEEFILMPNTTRTINFFIKPSRFCVTNFIIFKVFTENKICNNECNNFLSYKIGIKCIIKLVPSIKSHIVESLHKLREQNLKYTYIGDELNTKLQRDNAAMLFFKTFKTKRVIKSAMGILPKNANKYDCNYYIPKQETFNNFCKIPRKLIPLCEIFDLIFQPYIINFDKIEINTFGFQQFTIKNNSVYEISIIFQKHKCITYTQEHLQSFKVKIKPATFASIKINCLAYFKGSHKGTFEYIIENIYYLQHPYTVQVKNAILSVKDKILKFGMLYSDNFVTSIALPLYNNYNVPVEYKWTKLDTTPFKIIPDEGHIPSYSCRICNVQYLCKQLKAKVYEIDVMSCKEENIAVPIEMHIFTKKHAIKFSQKCLIFKDIPLNLKIFEDVELENLSKEFAVFNIIEPLISGFTIEPMYGVIKPKMIMNLKVVVKIPCVLDFAFDINIKINNKDIICLAVSGNVIEPDIIINPRHICIPRIPCFMTTYIPVSFQNVGTLKSLVSILNVSDDTMFKIYIQCGDIKKQVFDFEIGSGETKKVFIKIFGTFRREYDMYLPFQINNLLGPPNKDECVIDLHYYTDVYKT